MQHRKADDRGGYMKSLLMIGAAVVVIGLAACGGVAPPVVQGRSTSLPDNSQMARPTTAPAPAESTAGRALEVVRPAPVQRPTVVVRGVADAPAVVDLVGALRERGVAPEIADVSRIEFLTDAPGQAYRIGDGWLNLHLYPTAAAARAKTTAVQDGLANPAVDWVAPPHAFHCERLIAIYFGTDDRVTRALTERCGAQIAGVR